MDLPADTTLKIDGNKMVVSGPKGTLERKFDSRQVSIKADAGKIVVVSIVKQNKKVLSLVNTTLAHLRNMVKGVHELYETKLSLVYAHFPVTIEVKGKELTVKNFLGEKTPRATKIIGATKVVVTGQEISVTGVDKDEVTQTASNIVRCTRITNRDRRVFQDGIYYT